MIFSKLGASFEDGLIRSSSVHFSIEEEEEEEEEEKQSLKRRISLFFSHLSFCLVAASVRLHFFSAVGLISICFSLARQHFSVTSGLSDNVLPQSLGSRSLNTA